MPDPVDSPYLVPHDGTFFLDSQPNSPPKSARDKAANKQALAETVDRLDELQRVLYAHDQHSVLLVFQAMDAAGKDSTIRAILSGVNPAGCQVSSFKAPSSNEIEHDFLWRTTLRLPERGRIGVFNRSHYEEVLVVRVHPEYLERQRLPGDLDLDGLWKARFQSIRNWERHLARNGTVIVKFFLNVSRDEQKHRFFGRLDRPEKNWKFNPGDVAERARWDDYMEAYEAALNATSRKYAPWYAIPADDKPFMRATVADIVARTLEGLDLTYPTVDAKDRVRFDEMRAILDKE